jgi:hypothetical protein
MWGRLVEAWDAICGRTPRPPDPPQHPELIPPELLANLQELVRDELEIRQRKRRGDRYQRAGLITGAALLVSSALFVVIADDLSPGHTLIPTSGDIPILLATLAVTGAAVVWNVLGWLGAREGVSFWWLQFGWAVATFLCLLLAYAGAFYLYVWSTGGKFPVAWANVAGWGAVAASLLPALVALFITIRLEFLGAAVERALSAREIPWPAKAVWVAYPVFFLLAVLSALEVTNLTPHSLPSPELTTVVFAIPYVCSGLSLIAAVPIVIVARQRWRRQTPAR